MRPRSASALAVSGAFLGLVVLGTPGAFPQAGGGSVQEAPAPPKDVRARAVGTTRIEVTWQEGGSSHEYRVYRDGRRVAQVDDDEYLDTGLQPGTTYSYQVSTVNPAGQEGEKSDPVEATTHSGDDDEDDDDDDNDDDDDDDDRVDDDDDDGNGGDDGSADGDDGDDDGDDGDDGGDDGDDGGDADSSPPTRPDNLEVNPVNSSRADLSWSPARDNESGISKYRIYRDGRRITETSSTSFSDTGLSPATTYRYEVSAVNGAGREGSRTEAVQITTPRPEDVPPAPPTGLRVIS